MKNQMVEELLGEYVDTVPLEKLDAFIDNIVPIEFEEEDVVELREMYNGRQIKLNILHDLEYEICCEIGLSARDKNIFTDRFYDVLAELIGGKKQAEQYVKLLTHTCRTTQSNSAVKYCIKDFLNRERCLKRHEILYFILIIMLSLFEVSEVNKWFVPNTFQESFEQKVYNTTRRDLLDTAYDSEEKAEEIEVVDMQILGRLSYMPLEKRKNIIGSLWNCIIDIISSKATNKVEGGEE